MYLFFITATIVVAITVFQLLKVSIAWECAPVSNSFSFRLCLICALASQYYASPRVTIFEKADIFLAWFLCMAICALVPLDVTTVRLFLGLFGPPFCRTCAQGRTEYA